jgi:CheY-like chemotaxis protein
MSTVLVVEDEANVRKLVAVNLIRRGYTVIEATDVHQALDYLHRAAPDLMVLDIKLPDLTGWDLLKKIASDPSIQLSCPVLTMTASIMDAHVDRIQYPNVVEALIKPFSVTNLIMAVERALRTSISG